MLSVAIAITLNVLLFKKVGCVFPEKKYSQPYFVGEVNRAFYRRMVPSNGSLGSNLTCAILIPSAISVISVGFEQRSE